MKKLSVLLVMVALVGACVFAAGPSIRLGAGYETLSTKILDEKNMKKANATEFKTSGLSVDLGADYGITDALYVYGDFGMAFPGDYKIKAKGATKAVSAKKGYKENLDKKKDLVSDTKGTKRFLDYHFDLGAAYSINKLVAMPVDILAGGGVAFDLFTSYMKFESKTANSKAELKDSVMDLGLNLHVEAAYKFMDNLSASLVLNPNVMLYNNYKHDSLNNGKAVSSEAVKKGGVQVGFQFLASLGVKYTF